MDKASQAIHYHAGDVIEENISFADFVERYDGQAVEWHAGKVVVKVTNNTQHNFIQLFLSRLLADYLEASDSGILLTAGVPMFINESVPAREPDLMILLNENTERIRTNNVLGAVDIAVEIISPSSMTIDRGEKFSEYESAGVKEYWLIDPIRKAVDIYALDEQGYYQRINQSGKNIISEVLPSFELEAAILWREELPKGAEILRLIQAMLNEEADNG